MNGLVLWHKLGTCLVVKSHLELYWVKTKQNTPKTNQPNKTPHSFAGAHFESDGFKETLRPGPLS